MRTDRTLIEILNIRRKRKMTAANALKYYEAKSTAKQRRSLGQRFMKYMNDNALYFASVNAVTGGSLYSFSKYILPALQEK